MVPIKIKKSLEKFCTNSDYVKLKCWLRLASKHGSKILSIFQSVISVQGQFKLIFMVNSPTSQSFMVMNNLPVIKGY